MAAKVWLLTNAALFSLRLDKQRVHSHVRHGRGNRGGQAGQVEKAVRRRVMFENGTCSSANVMMR